MRCELGRLVRLAMVAVTVSGCGSMTDSGDCTMEGRNGLEVEVRDSVSGQPAASGATVRVASETFQEQQSYPDGISPDPLVFGLAVERAGTFVVTVRKAGYVDWVGGAVVRTGRCHVQTARVVAKLQRLPAT